jgi:hypothetical protein
MVPFPEGDDCGNGWWRVEWVITTDPPDPPTRLRLPIPSPYLEDLTVIVAVLPRESGQLVLEALTRSSRLEWNEIAYLSSVLRAIRAQYRHITVDGYSDHPMLSVSNT